MKKIVNFIKRNATGWLLLLPVVFCLVIVKWSPIIEGIYKSFFGTRGYETTEFVAFENYKNVLTDTMFLKILWNTVKYVLWSLVIGAPIPLILALLLNEVRVVNKVFRVVTYLPSLVPGVALAFMWTQIYSPADYGLLNSVLEFFHLPAQEWLQNPKIAIPLLIAATSWQGAPGTAIVYLAKLQSVRQDLYEASLLDGAGLWRRFCTVALPAISSTILLMVARQIIGVFQIIELPLLMTGGGPDNATISLNLASYRYAFTYMQVAHALALGVCMFIFLLAISVVYFKVEKKLKD